MTQPPVEDEGSLEEAAVVSAGPPASRTRRAMAAAATGRDRAIRQFVTLLVLSCLLAGVVMGVGVVVAGLLYLLGA